MGELLSSVGSLLASEAAVDQVLSACPFPILCSEASIWEASGDTLVGVSMSRSESHAASSWSVFTRQQHLPRTCSMSC